VVLALEDVPGFVNHIVMLHFERNGELDIAYDIVVISAVMDSFTQEL
jgi:hypothetical protein